MALLQAQLEAPKYSTLKLSAFNAVVELIVEILFPEILVTTDSLQKGEGAMPVCSRLSQSLSLCYLGEMVQAFEPCATEAVHPSGSAKEDQPTL